MKFAERLLHSLTAACLTLVAAGATLALTGCELPFAKDSDENTASTEATTGTETTTGTPPGPAVRDGGTDSADRLIFWLNCEKLAGITDAELDAWKGRGVDGFVCMVGHLEGMGGSQDFTADPGADLSGANYELQRALRDSDLVGRAAAREMKMYLGAKLVNYYNTATPLKEWFDDRGWSEVVVPKVSDLAGAARQLGFAGLAFDQELYRQTGGAVSATWEWDYPGNTHSEEEVRAKATERGRQVMEAIVGAFPGAELMAYDVRFPETWLELVKEEVNGIEDAYAPRLDIDFWDGLTSVEGYGAIRLVDATFYKTTHRPATWDTALQYQYNRLSSLLSRNLSNWEYASSRFYASPFSWIDEGPTASSEFDDARPPAYVEEQLLAFRKWGMGGEFANYAFSGLDGFDYSPYVGAMQEASTPATVDPEAPTLEVASSPGSGAPAVIEGTAHDNLAVWAVRWRDDRGGSGVAELDWNVISGDYSSGYVWETRWSFPVSDLSPGATQVTIAAEDIKGHATTASLTWTADGGPGPASPEEIGGAAPSHAETIDTRPPQTRISTRPRRRSHDRTPRFRFTADEPAGGFACRIDRKRWSACDGGAATYRLEPGRHSIEVRATDLVGNTDPTPARYLFTIKRG
jgi:hypothetical protein